MSLFAKRATNIAVIDVRTSSIGAGYAVLSDGKPPALVYGTRTPLIPNATEPSGETFDRTLATVLHALTTEGSTTLRGLTGSGSVTRVFITFTAPWQESRVESHTIAKDKPFVFTKQLLEETLRKADTKPGKDRHSVRELTLATLLNGYEVSEPFGKRATRAEFITLSSTLDATIEDTVVKAVRSAVHQHDIECAAFIPEVYTVFRDLYPHQKDFLILDIGSEATDVLLVKHGLLVAAVSTPHGVGEMMRAARGAGVSSLAVPTAEGELIDSGRNSGFASAMQKAEEVWIGQMAAMLGGVAEHEPLPRTVFLLAEDGVRDFLKRKLDAPKLRSLWLSDEALAILPILPSQFTPFLGEASTNPPDMALALLTLAATRR